MPASDDRRDALTRSRHLQLGAFLRARRANIAPQDVGLPQRKRRHVPGLRREEVAQLAQIGVSWYTLLEQGRIDHVAAKTLRRVIRALRLSPVEAEHALALAREASYDVRRPTAHRCLLRDERRGDVPMHFLAFAPIDHPDHVIVTLREDAGGVGDQRTPPARPGRKGK